MKVIFLYFNVPFWQLPEQNVCNQKSRWDNWPPKLRCEPETPQIQSTIACYSTLTFRACGGLLMCEWSQQNFSIQQPDFYEVTEYDSSSGHFVKQPSSLTLYGTDGLWYVYTSSVTNPEFSGRYLLQYFPSPKCVALWKRSLSQKNGRYLWCSSCIRWLDPDKRNTDIHKTVRYSK
jgi:hypothetical protein